MLKTHPLLQRYPAFISLLLITSALLLVIVSCNAKNIFPVFALIGTSPALPCLLLACVLGICGTLTSIVSILEYVDRAQVPHKLPPEAKEYYHDRH
jgi:O-antigen/teichoic acid export membrane protein